MLAGTVNCDSGQQILQNLLTQHGIAAQIVDDEIVVTGEARISFRTGFEHEYILVGDAHDGDILLAAIHKVSTVLYQQKINHAYEVYDTENNQIFDYTFEN